MPEMKIISVDRIRPNPFQPREKFDKEKIRELADSIDESGLLQPILVRKKGEAYEIIAGERRWRAFQFIKLREIPCIIKEVDDHQAKELSLAENWHRLNLETKEAEDFVWSIWKEGRKSGKYKSISDMSRKTRIPLQTLEAMVLAHEDREEISTGGTYRDYGRTRTLKEEPELRKKVLKLREEGKIRAEDLRKFSKTVKEVSPSIREALFKRTISTDEARMIDTELDASEEKEEVIRDLEKERSTSHVEAHIDFVRHEEERKGIEAEMVRTATGDVWICPICNKKYRLVHVDPIGTHRFEEVEE